MPRPTLTRALAFAASLDEGNRSMHAGRRAEWSVDDYNAAATAFQRLWPDCPHGIAPEHLCCFCNQDQIPAAHPLSNKRPSASEPR